MADSRTALAGIATVTGDVGSGGVSAAGRSPPPRVSHCSAVPPPIEMDDLTGRAFDPSAAHAPGTVLCAQTAALATISADAVVVHYSLSLFIRRTEIELTLVSCDQ
jgi:hypothetical protein